MAEPSEGEVAIRAACDGGDFAAAATLAVERYGAEIYAFILDRLRDVPEADEVFAAFTEAYWLSLRSFEWRCSARTWGYKLARRCIGQHRRDTRRERQRRGAGATPPDLAEVAARARTTTLRYLQTEVKDRLQQLRAQLPDEDQLLLVLRVNRGLAWLEIAEVMHDASDTPDADTLSRSAARWRKRFQLAKEKLRELAAREGLLPSE
jgi:RNA polymerase sigma-70 factor (ECF subfamily)